jgi:microcystin-dependent protein
MYAPAPANTTMNPAALAQTGGGQPHENMPPFLAINFIIATQGIFPARN